MPEIEDNPLNRILAIIWKLNPKRDTDQIVKLAGEILNASTSGKMLDREAFRSVGSKSSAKGLDATITHFSKGLAGNDKLSPEANYHLLKAVEQISFENRLQVLDAPRHLKVLVEAMKIAKERIESGDQIKPGRPVKHQAKRVTEACAIAFQELTGRKPTMTTNSEEIGSPVSGLFPDLLEDMFRALEIDAKVESQIRLWEKKEAKKNAA